MRFVNFLITISTVFIAVQSPSTWSMPTESTLQGPYLGLPTPGDTPVLFGPGLVSTQHYSYGGTFSPDMRSFSFLRKPNAEVKVEFVVFQQRGETWIESIFDSRIGQPIFSPDGKVMHLGKRIKKRRQEGWTKAVSLGPDFDKYRIMRMSSSLAGTYVFDEVGSPEGDGIIRFSQLLDGERQAPQAFGNQINSGTFNAHPFIAPDESYLIWDGRRPEGYGGSDIYISFKQEDGRWGDAINMGSDINTDGWDAAASVTPDGKFILFHRLNEHGNANIFWVSATIIDRLRDAN